MAIVDAIQIHFQDVALAVEVVDQGGQNEFFELSLDGCLVSDKQNFNELLGNGAAAFYDAAILYIVEGCAENAQQVYALVGPERLVLGGNGGIPEQGSDLVELDGSMQSLLGELSEQDTFAVVNFEVVEWHKATERVYLLLIGCLGMLDEVIEGGGADSSQ